MKMLFLLFGLSASAAFAQNATLLVSNTHNPETIQINAEGEDLLTPLPKTDKIKPSKIYPFFAMNIVNIPIKQGISPATIVLYDILGNKIQIEPSQISQTEDSLLQLNVAHLQKGQYFLSIEIKPGERQISRFQKI